MTVGAVLRAELAPSPARWRATARLGLACLVGLVAIQALHLPHGEWLLVTVFVVAQPDAGASLKRGLERSAGTLIAGAVTILGAVAFADAPWALATLIAIALSAGTYLSLTSSSPYVGLLAAMTISILLDPEGGSAGVATPLWRIATILLGVAIGTVVQVLVLPDDPEEMLLDDIAVRLGTIDRLLGPGLGTRLHAPPPGLVEASGLVRQLDLLTHAEALNGRLRLRHAEQAALVANVDRLLVGTLALHQVHGAVDPPLAARIEAVRAALARVRAAIVARAPLSEGVAVAPVGNGGAGGAAGRSGGPAPAALGAGPAALVTELERVTRDLPATLGFLGRPASAPPRSSLDRPEHASFLLPSFRRLAREDVRPSLEAGLSGMLAWLTVQALAWPAVSTCIVTTQLIAQQTRGASLWKSLLRVAGAGAGAVMGLLAVIALLPQLESVAGLLLVLLPLYLIAAWVTVGGPRLSYAGFQTALALSLMTAAAYDLEGVVRALSVGRDRVIGILIGVALWAVVNRLWGPSPAVAVARGRLAAALAAMANLLRAGPRGQPGGDGAGLAPDAVPFRREVYGALAAALRALDDVAVEPAPAAVRARRAADADAVLAMVSRAQAVFLAALAVVRHRADVSLELPESDPTRRTVRECAVALGSALDALAARVEPGRAPAEPPDPGAGLAQARAALASPAVHPAGSPAGSALAARVALYAEVVRAVDDLAGCCRAPAPAA